MPRKPGRKSKKGLGLKKTFRRIDKTDVKKIVKKMIDQSIEDKRCIYETLGRYGGANYLVVTTAGNIQPLTYDLNPTIDQGGERDERIGNKVRIKKALAHFNCMLSGATINAGVDVPCNIYYAILKNKDYPVDMSTVLPADNMNNMFLNTNNSTTYFQSGNIYSPTKPFNHYQFTVYKHNFGRPIKLGWAGAQAATDPRSSNNDYKAQHSFTIDFTRYLPKTLDFANSTTIGLDSSTNGHLFMVFWCQKINLDVTIANWDPPFVACTIDLTYEDA